MNQQGTTSEQLVVSNVLTLLFTKHIEVQAVIDMGPALVEGVLEVLKEVATSDDEPLEARTFAAMAVCRILTNVAFQPIEIRGVTPERFRKTLAALPKS